MKNKKNKNKNKNIYDDLTSKCAPNSNAKIQLENGEVICMSEEQINTLIKAYNVSDNRNRKNKKPIDINLKEKNVQEKFNALKEALNCNDQMCVLGESKNLITEKSLIDQIINNQFRPIGPADNNDWLSNMDISAVIKQYTDINPEIEFYGPFSADIHKHNVRDLFGAGKIREDTAIKDILTKCGKNNEEFKRVGITFNTDPHNKSGAHWVSLIIINDKENSKIELNYFDSVGKDPNEDILTFIKLLINTSFKCYPQRDIIYRVNKKNVQRGNTECGMYSINFMIDVLIQGHTWDEFIENGLMPDKEVEKLRQFFFISESEVVN